MPCKLLHQVACGYQALQVHGQTDTCPLLSCCCCFCCCARCNLSLLSRYSLPTELKATSPTTPALLLLSHWRPSRAATQTKLPADRYNSLLIQDPALQLLCCVIKWRSSDFPGCPASNLQVTFKQSHLASGSRGSCRCPTGHMQPIPRPSASWACSVHTQP